MYIHVCTCTQDDFMHVLYVQCIEHIRQVYIDLSELKSHHVLLCMLLNQNINAIVAREEAKGNNFIQAMWSTQGS